MNKRTHRCYGARFVVTVDKIHIVASGGCVLLLPLLFLLLLLLLQL